MTGALIILAVGLVCCLVAAALPRTERVGSGVLLTAAVASLPLALIAAIGGAS